MRIDASTYLEHTCRLTKSFRLPSDFLKAGMLQEEEQQGTRGAIIAEGTPLNLLMSLQDFAPPSPSPWRSYLASRGGPSTDNVSILHTIAETTGGILNTFESTQRERERSVTETQKAREEYALRGYQATLASVQENTNAVAAIMAAEVEANALLASSGHAFEGKKAHAVEKWPQEHVKSMFPLDLNCDWLEDYDLIKVREKDGAVTDAVYHRCCGAGYAMQGGVNFMFSSSPGVRRPRIQGVLRHEELDTRSVQTALADKARTHKANCKTGSSK